MRWRARLPEEAIKPIRVGRALKLTSQTVHRAPPAVPRAQVQNEMARRGLEERLGVPVETIDPTRVAMLTDRITVTRDVMARLAPLVGMMLRTRQETAAA